MTDLPQKWSASGINWTTVSKRSLFDSRTGYDLIAKSYDRSPWRRFWRKNEYPIVHKIFLKLLQKYQFHRAVDIGTGTGVYAKFLRNYVKDVVGIDVSMGMLKVAQKKSRGEYIHEDFLNFESDKRFDFALCARTLSHISGVDQFWRKVDDLTTDGGCVVITDIHPKHNYYRTRFDVGDEIVEIETYKHEMNTIFDRILRNLSDQIMYKEFDFRSLNDKWVSLNLRSAIGSIDPIFYIIVFRKNSKIDDRIYSYLRDTLKFNSITNA